MLRQLEKCARRDSQRGNSFANFCHSKRYEWLAKSVPKIEMEIVFVVVSRALRCCWRSLIMSCPLNNDGRPHGSALAYGILFPLFFRSPNDPNVITRRRRGRRPIRFAFECSIIASLSCALFELLFRLRFNHEYHILFRRNCRPAISRLR